MSLEYIYPVVLALVIFSRHCQLFFALYTLVLNVWRRTMWYQFEVVPGVPMLGVYILESRSQVNGTRFFETDFRRNEFSQFPQDIIVIRVVTNGVCRACRVFETTALSASHLAPVRKLKHSSANKSLN